MFCIKGPFMPVHGILYIHTKSSLWRPDAAINLHKIFSCHYRSINTQIGVKREEKKVFPFICFLSSVTHIREVFSFTVSLWSTFRTSAAAINSTLLKEFTSFVDTCPEPVGLLMDGYQLKWSLSNYNHLFIVVCCAVYLSLLVCQRCSPPSISRLEESGAESFCHWEKWVSWFLTLKLEHTPAVSQIRHFSQYAHM